MGRSSNVKVDVRADGTGLSSRAGTALLALAAERLGLTDALGWALAETRERRSAHDPGRVFCDLAVMLADGGRCVSDLVALASQPALFGDVASVSTARRVVLSLGEGELDRVRAARAQARERAWAAGAAPAEVILDFDATPITAHSEKELAAGHYKGGFGFHPLLASCGREVLAAILRSEPELEQAAARAMREATNSAIVYLGSILFEDDELVLCLFDADSRAAVRTTAERAGIPCERVMGSHWLAPPTIHGGIR